MSIIVINDTTANPFYASRIPRIVIEYQFTVPRNSKRRRDRLKAWRRFVKANF